MFGDDYVFNDNMFSNEDKIIFHIDVNSAYLLEVAYMSGLL